MDAEMDTARLQEIDTAIVRNRTSFGRGLQRLARELSTDLPTAMGDNLQYEGCLVFAQALHKWSSGQMELVGIYAKGVLDARHVMVSVDGLYLDNLGVATTADVEARMAAFRRMPVMQIGPYDLDVEAGFEEDDELSSRWAHIMQGVYGTWGPGLRRQLGVVSAPLQNFAYPAPLPAPLPAGDVSEQSPVELANPACEQAGPGMGGL